MKRILIIAIIMIAGCNSAPDRNEVMTKLINEKKVIEDSIEITEGGTAMYEAKAKESLHATHDTAIAYPFSDTSALYFGLGIKLKERLKAVNFSIDSISKMK